MFRAVNTTHVCLLAILEMWARDVLLPNRSILVPLEAIQERRPESFVKVNLQSSNNGGEKQLGISQARYECMSNGDTTE